MSALLARLQGDLNSARKSQDKAGTLLLGTVLSELFPTSVRYTGNSLTFNFAGILGASLAPYIATWLAKNYGLQYVGYYLSAAAALTLIGLFATRETKDQRL